MISVDVVNYPVLVAFWIAFSRFTAIVYQLPLFDNIAVPQIVKILASLMMTYVFFPHIEAELLKDITYIGMENFWMLTIFNVVIGLTIGFLVKVIMNLFVAAGAIITQQIGFGAAKFFDPTIGQQVGSFERLIQLVMIMLIISSGALLPMFKGIMNSFHSIHIYEIGKIGQITLFFLETFKGLFLSALMLASPLIFTNMLILSVLGIIARTVPQMNIIMVSFVVNIGLGLLVFIATSEEFFHVGFKLYTEQLGRWFQFIS